MQQQVPTQVKEVEKTEVVVEPCGSWSEFFRCPLIIFSVLAFIFFIADIWTMWSVSQRTTTGSGFWVTSILSLLIYLVFIFIFGYWMKKKCEDCKYGQSWLIFVLAIFFPIILGFIVNVIIGAFAGGVSYLSTSMAGPGKSGKGAKGKPPAPGVPAAAVATGAAAASAQSAQQAQAAAIAAQQAANQQAAAAAAQPTSLLGGLNGLAGALGNDLANIRNAATGVF